MTASTLAVWLVAIMVAAAPPDRHAALPSLPGWAETQEAREARYVALARAAAEVALDPQERPLFGEQFGRERTAAALLAVAFHESGFAADVDRGPCYRGRDGNGQRCDGGQSACVMQVKVGRGSTREGWSREQLFGDRRKCFAAGLHLLQRQCSGPRALALSSYAGGSCENPTAQRRSRELVDYIDSWAARLDRAKGGTS